MRELVSAGDGFRVGRVLSQAFSLLFRHFPKFIILGLVATLPLLLILINPITPPRPGQPIGAEFGYTVGGFGILWFLLMAICQAAMIYGAFQAMRGQDFGIGESIGRGLRRLLPVILTSICAVAVTGIGLMLLLVPGFIFLTMFIVAIPACVVEGLGPFRSLGRSRALTKGRRWRLLGLFLALFFLAAIVRIPVELLLHAIGGQILGGIGSFLYSAVATAYELMVIVVAYHDLRAEKEGVDVEQIASVFD
jgi:hypothetical protein